MDLIFAAGKPLFVQAMHVWMPQALLAQRPPMSSMLPGRNAKRWAGGTHQLGLNVEKLSYAATTEQFLLDGP
jgi:hypothetical protein